MAVSGGQDVANSGDGGARDQAADIAMHGRGGLGTAIVSLTALVVSGVSLWETVLRQPELTLYVGDMASYTRDPWGGYEVFVVPLTIANNGAQDGAVIKLTLEVKNTASGLSDRFESAYSVDATYFSGRDDVSARTRRPKLPFAPLSIAGRQSYSGTLLFYPQEFREQKVVEPKSRIEVTLSAVSLAPTGWLDRALGSRPGPVSLTFEVPNFMVGGLLAGDLARLKPIAKPSP